MPLCVHVPWSCKLIDSQTSLVPSGTRGSVYTDNLSSGSLRGMRFGLVEGFFDRTASSETTPVNHAMASMQAQLEDAGATIVPLTESVYNVTTIAAALDTQRYEYRQEMDAYLQQPSLKGQHPNTLTELYRDTHKFLVLPIQHEFVNTALVSSTSNITTGTYKGYDAVQSGIQDLKLALRETFLRNQLDAMIYPQQKNLVVKIGSPSQSGRNGILAALTGSPVVTVSFSALVPRACSSHKSRMLTETYSGPCRVQFCECRCSCWCTSRNGNPRPAMD